MTLLRTVPVPAESIPTTRRSIPHGKISNDKLIGAIFRHDTLTDIAPHSHIDQNPVIPHRSRSRRFASLHDWSAINIPHQSALSSIFIFIPSEIKSHALGRGDVRNGCFYHAVFVVVFAVEMAPVQTSVVRSIPVPGFEDVDFAVVGPGKWILGQ